MSGGGAGRERLRLLGVLAGAVATVYAAVEGHVAPAIVFGVATLAVGAGTLYARRPEE
jgi:hypothetical protein